MNRFCLLLLASALSLLVVAGSLSARLVPDWPVEKLMRESDLVVIARAEANADSGDINRDHGWKVKFIGVNTTFKAEQVLKGKLKGDKLTVLHYRVENGTLIENGPRHVTFRTASFFLHIDGPDPAKVGIPAPQYLLYLRGRKDGRYEPVSGIIDPDLSVQEIFPAGTARHTFERLEKKKK
jgi:hypothetical protein